MVVKFGGGDTASGQSDVPGASSNQGAPQGGSTATLPQPNNQPNIVNPNISIVGPNLAQELNKDQGLTGNDRWQAARQATAFAQNSQQYDQWVLGLNNDPNDTAYNNIVSAEKQRAQLRTTLRQQVGLENLTAEDEKQIEQGLTPTHLKPSAVSTGTSNTHPAADRQQNQADQAKSNTHDFAGRAGVFAADQQQRASVNARRGANEDATRGKPQGHMDQIIGPDGKPIQSPATSTTTGAKSQSGSLVQGATSAQAIGKQVVSGDYVWVGASLGQDVGPAAQGGTVHQADNYMSVADAKDVIARWDPASIIKFQKLMGLKPTGLPDTKTMSSWGNVIDTSALLTKAGKKMDPLTVAITYAKQYTNTGSGGGGGGGGGAGTQAKFQLSDVQSLLTTVMQKEAGRDPTQAEVNSFYSYFNGLAGGDTANPSQLATDWVRQNLGAQVGSYGAATNYYQAMLSVLGASPVGGSGG
jgi:hypothetical protein